MPRTLLAILALLLASAAVSAAPANEDARAALRKAIDFHRKADDLAFFFKAETYNAALDKKDRYQGRLYMKDSTKFRLEIPAGTYVSNGTVFWEFHPQNKQMLVKDAKGMGRSGTPGEVLLRFLDAEPIAIGKASMGGKEYLELRLDPSGTLKNLDSLSVLLDPKNHSLRRVGSRDVSGNLADYTLITVKRNGGLADKQFEFEPPKGTEVVDMR